MQYSFTHVITLIGCLAGYILGAMLIDLQLIEEGKSLLPSLLPAVGGLLAYLLAVNRVK